MDTKEILSTIKSNLEVETNKRKLVVDDVFVEENNTKSKKKQKSTALNGQTLADRIYAKVSLVDKESGKVISKDKIKVADLPVKNDAKTFIIDGSHYQSSDQKRLGHAPYLRQMENGKAEVKFNTGKGPTFALMMDPETKLITTKVKDTEIDAYPMMKLMGHTDEELKSIWGAKVFEKNKLTDAKYDKKLKSLYNKISFAPDKGLTTGEMEQSIRESMDNTTLDPKKTSITMGVEADKVNKNLLGVASKNLLEFFKGKRDEDNRDDMVFSDYHQIDSQVVDALKSRRKNTNKRIWRKMDRVDDVNSLVDYNMFNDSIKDVLVRGKLTNATETTNILDIESNDSKATIMGEKGISNKSVVTAEARSVAPSSAGFVDPVKTGAGDPGVSFHRAYGAKIGDKKNLLIDLINLKTGKIEKVSNHDIFEQKIAYPGEFENEGGRWVPQSMKIKGFQKGKFKEFLPSEVEYVMPDGRLMYSAPVNLIPFISGDSGPRGMYGSNQMTQAVSLVNRENPIVQNGIDGNETFEDVVGKEYVTKSDVNGEVVKITNDEIHIKSGKKTHKIEIYDNMNLNQGGFIHETPIIKVGDKVKAGQVLTDNNYTKGGSLALGTNLVTALMPMKGYNYEDAVVISETASEEKLVSEHLVSVKRDLNKTDILSKKKFMSLFPAKVKRRNAEQIDENGVIKVGSVVNTGDILAMISAPREINKDDAAAGLVKKMRSKMFKSNAITYDEHDQGVVTDVSVMGNRIQVNIKYKSKMKVGDKVSARDGGKGIVSIILPDEEMPYKYDENGEKIYADIAMDPHGVPSRANPGQILEIGAAKIAEKKGDSRYIVENMQSDTDYANKIDKEQDQLGIADKETVYMGDDNPIPEINFGKKYIVKLRHQIDHKADVRTPFGDEGYDMNMQPIKGKSTDHLMAYSMLSHGAYENAAEMATSWKAEKNDKLWDHIRKGGSYQALPNKTETFSFRKFEDMLRSAGVNVKRNKTNFTLAPMTDDDIMELSNGEIKNHGTINMKDMSAVKGGLFDNEITGGERINADNFDNLFSSTLTGGTGQAGKKWSHIELPFKMVTPVYERPVAKLLNISVADLHRIAKGEKELNGQTGTQAIHDALSGLNLKNMRSDLEEKAKTAKKSQYNDISDKIDYIKALQKNGQKPQDAYMTSKVAVLPPMLRPIVELPNGSKRAADVNYYYRNLIASSDKYRKAQELTSVGAATQKDLANQYDEVVNTVKMLHGVNKDEEDGKKGILSQIAGTGSQPKNGFFQSEVVSRKQELSSRSTIVADPTLSMDEIGIGESIAWQKYSPFVANALVKRGMTPLDARTAIENKTGLARAALEREMKVRPVLVNRAPSWQKYNVVALRPKIMPETKNSGLQYHFPNLPVNSFMGGDYDGDQVTLHVPIGMKATEEAKRMFPSNFLYKAGYHGKLMLKPEHSAVYGLYKMTEKSKDVGETRYFETVEDAVKAEKKKEISLNQIINVNGEKGTLGRMMLNSFLPDNHQLDGETELDSPNISKLLKNVAKDKKANYREILDNLNQIGNDYATTSGLSIGVKDLIPKSNFVNDIYAKTEKAIDRRIAGRKVSEQDQDKIKIEEYSKAQKEIEDKVMDNLSDNNSFKLMAKIKSKGNAAQIRQITSSFGLSKDERGNVVPIAVKGSFGQGLTPAEYYIQQIGARGGIVQKAEGTSRPGEIGKELVALGADRAISMKDCGTDRGIYIAIDTLDVYDRFTQVGNKGIAPNLPVTHRIITELKEQGVRKIFVRSPLTCEADTGVCQHCYGMNEDGRKIAIGQNVGILDAQVLTEHSANASMKAFHTTGAGKGASGFDRYFEILRMPKNVKGKSILAKEDGTIDKVKKNEFGGYDVTMGEYKYSTNAFEPLNVKVGDTLEKGDQITKGSIKPQELLEYKGMDAVQEYMTDELGNVFEMDGKAGSIKRRTFENVIAGLTSTVQVTDAGDSDVTPFTFKNKNKVKAMNDKIIQKAVSNGESPRLIEFNHVLQSSDMMPTLKDSDWLAQTDFRRIKKQLTTSAAKGATSDVAGINAISRYAYGANTNSYMKGETPLYEKKLDDDKINKVDSRFGSSQFANREPSQNLVDFKQKIMDEYLS